MPIENFPSRLKTLLDLGWIHTYPAIDITLSDGTELHYSTVDIEFDGTVYESRLKSVGAIKTTLNSAVNRCEMKFDNSDLAVGDALDGGDIDDLLDNAKAIVYRIYVNIDNHDEKWRIERISGIVQASVEDESDEVNLTVVGHAYAGGGVAKYTVKRNCVWDYKDGVNCRYSGALATCDLSFDGVNGCVVHFGSTEEAKANFGGGARDLDEETRQAHQSNTGSGGGTVIIAPGGNCFIAGTRVDLSKRLSLPIELIEPRMTIESVNRTTFSTRRDTVVDTFEADAERIVMLQFKSGVEIGVVPTHPFLVAPDEFETADELYIGAELPREIEGRWTTDRLIGKTYLEGKFRVYNLHALYNNTYKVFGFPVKNNKSPYEINTY